MGSTAGKTFKCIDVLGRSQVGLTVSEVATATKLSWPAASRLLEGLAKESIVVREPSKRYRLSLRFCEWASLAVQSRLPINIARKELVRLTIETGRQYNLVVMEDLETVIVERCELVDGIPINRFVSARRIWFETATGKALVAFSPAHEREALLRSTFQLKVHRLPDREALERELDEVSELGYAKASDVHPPGIIGVVVPILDQSGFAVAAIGSFLPTPELDGEEGTLLISKLSGAAGLISHYLGYEGEVATHHLGISPILS